MEKVLFMMRRKDGLTRRQFGEHYLQVHTLLGMRLCVGMAGYSVNLTDEVDPGPEGPDSVTEVWTPDAAAFLDVERAFRNAEEGEELMRDDRSFIGINRAWLVEERLLHGDPPRGPLRTRTPGAKRVSLHRGGARPALAPGVTRAVEQRVVKALAPDAAPVDFFLCEWAPSAEVFAPLSVPAYLVSEYRQRDPVG